MNDKKLLISIVEDDPAVLEMLDLLLQEQGYDTKTYLNPTLFLAEVHKLEINCIVSDVCMPGLNGLEMQQKLKSLNLELPVIFLTGVGDIKMAVQAMRDGAIEFLEKPIDTDRLFVCIEEALCVNQRLIEKEKSLKQFVESYERLTKREKEVLALIVEGSTNKSIGAKLNIAESTVEIHRSRVMKKTEAQSSAHLIKMALTARIPAYPIQ
jgi:FixJ family two-component response regulator